MYGETRGVVDHITEQVEALPRVLGRALNGNRQYTRRIDESDRVPVCRRIRERRKTDFAARSCSIDHDDPRAGAEVLLEVRHERSRDHVSAAAWDIREDHGDHALWIGSGAYSWQVDEHCGGACNHRVINQSHGFTPPLTFMAALPRGREEEVTRRRTSGLIIAASLPGQAAVALPSERA